MEEHSPQFTVTPSFITFFWENLHFFLCPAVTTSEDKLQQRAVCATDLTLQQLEPDLY